MPNSAPPESDTQVQGDVYCARCAYNLRTLPTNGNCPECNLPVACSLNTKWLQHADPAWLMRLSVGATFVVLSFVAFSAASLLGHSPEPLRALAGLLAELCGFCGAWLLTSPRRQAVLAGESQALRGILRVLYCGGLIFVASAGLSAVAGRPLVPSSVDRLLKDAFLLLWPTRYVLLLWYVHRFAAQAGGEGLARSSRIATCGIMACAGTLGAIFLLGHLVGTARTGWNDNTPLGGLVGCLLPVIMLGFAVFGIWSMVLFFLYARRFNEFARKGRAASADH